MRIPRWALQKNALRNLTISLRWLLRIFWGATKHLLQLWGAPYSGCKWHLRIADYFPLLTLRTVFAPRAFFSPLWVENTVPLFCRRRYTSGTFFFILVSQQARQCPMLCGTLLDLRMYNNRFALAARFPMTEMPLPDWRIDYSPVSCTASLNNWWSVISCVINMSPLRAIQVVLEIMPETSTFGILLGSAGLTSESSFAPTREIGNCYEMSWQWGLRYGCLDMAWLRLNSKWAALQVHLGSIVSNGTLCSNGSEVQYCNIGSCFTERKNWYYSTDSICVFAMSQLHDLESSCCAVAKKIKYLSIPSQKLCPCKMGREKVVDEDAGLLTEDQNSFAAVEILPKWGLLL